MMVEGAGMRPPAEIFVPVSSTELGVLRHHADLRDRFRRYAQRRDPWGRGFIKHPTLCGLLGEHALCVDLRKASVFLSVDIALRTLGDGGVDLAAHGLRMQVKTNRTGNANLIRRIDDRGNLLPLGCDLFVFARIGFRGKSFGVYLKGWIWAKDASGDDINRIKKSTVANHFNLQIAPAALLPMNRLYIEMRRRKAA